MPARASELQSVRHVPPPAQTRPPGTAACSGQVSQPVRRVQQPVRQPVSQPAPNLDPQVHQATHCQASVQ
ncbi:hypothetical protein PC116_g23062 [Phytophthora cactorum]|uniref:Uncharacterized protein n=1 Tax=Phytophthora cactorum TaxID=29920 RepID=A0A8T1K038_9STRA|nr:hypothetical protein PC112_g19158 [Phytophthora cactorum]KAG2803655.1 hypothetical protein PC111_g18593 [Phytophthora cactorum]KAG2840018.1 hypothetical protein PC113_g19352 [Phytophthora cactorum]KAG2884229.1 hypothetical protein PC114_g20203 [Phytophthora cactorum]KAG2893336.1 hypothetical protein PC115_g18503 [Phytophthora cactorum]